MMASSHVVIASASTTNSELPRRQSSICSLSTFLTDDEPQTLSSLTAMDDDHLFKNIQLYPEQSQLPELQPQPEAPFPVAGEDEVWAGVTAGGSDRRIDSGENGGVSEMTLDVFLMKNQLVREEDARVNPVGYGQYQMPSTQGAEGPMVVYGGNGSSGGASGRGKRRAVEEPLDKATEQKQRRMIKNRESAARSRERKQVRFFVLFFLNDNNLLCEFCLFTVKMKTRKEKKERKI